VNWENKKNNISGRKKSVNHLHMARSKLLFFKLHKFFNGTVFIQADPKREGGGIPESILFSSVGREVSLTAGYYTP
jgi:hypothetical protein